MKLFTYSTGAISRSHKFPWLLAVALLASIVFAGNALAAQAPVPLGTAGSFAVLAHTGVTDTAPNSTIFGDLGNDGNIPTTGSPNVTGVSHIGDGVAAGARADLNTAIGFASGAAGAIPLAAGTVAGTLGPGVYNSGSFTMNLPGAVTLDAGGDSSAVWIFQAPSDLIASVASTVSLTGGASACNVFWQVTSSATLNGSSFVGTVLASTSVTIGSGVTLAGRALAYTGDVTMMNDTIGASACSGSSSATQPPPREIYCTPAGVAYDLVAGQDKLPPYNALGLIPAYVDPVTGSKSCTFPAAIIPVVPTPVAPTPVTPTPVAPTPTAPTPSPAQKAVAAKKAAAVKAAKKKAARAAVLARRAKVQTKKAKPGAPPKTATGGFTG